MLHEHFIAATSAPPKLTSTNATLLKDAGVFIHSHQPQPGLKSTFKKSTTAPNCLAISPSHIFAAQTDKAVVHVYNRSKGNQEVTVPFPERIRSLVLVADGAVVVLGTEEGSILLWETCTGRQLAAPQSHLQAVTTLAVDPSNSYLLSGSDDSSILVWSLVDLLSFPAQSAFGQHETTTPRHTLSAHKGGVTSIAISPSATGSGTAVTGSKDQTAIIWDYRLGSLLRTFLLTSTPLCIVLDPADRGFYAGFDDGSVQLVDYYSASRSSHSTTSVRDPAHSNTPVQPSNSSRWTPPNSDIGATLSLSLSYDTTTLLTGHANGKIVAWDIANGTFRSTIADYVGSPITSLQFLSPTGFLSTRGSTLKFPAILKPRPHESFSSTKGRLSEAYTLSCQLTSELEPYQPQHSQIYNTILKPVIPCSLVESAIMELATFSLPSTIANPPTPAPDHILLNIDSMNSPHPTKNEVEELQKQIAHLKKLQNISTSQIAKLTHEAIQSRKREAQLDERRKRTEARRSERTAREWALLDAKNGNQMQNGAAKSTSTGMEVDGEDLSDTTSASDEEESDEI